MNATQFGKKYGMKHIRKVPKWYKMGYLGNATRNEKTGEYSIPDDIPLPYSASPNVTRLQTFWGEMLEAASEQQSLFSTMYPKLHDGTFEEQLQSFVDSGFLKIKKTKSGDSYLSLEPAGLTFMKTLNDSEKKDVLGKVQKLVSIGWTLTQAFIMAWPYIEPYINTVIH